MENCSSAGANADRLGLHGTFFPVLALLEAVANARDSNKAPFGIAALVVAAVTSLPVFFFDRLEAATEQFGLDGGPEPLLIVVGIFAFLWLVVGSGLLAFLSPRPALEGLLAGALVAGVILWIVVANVDVPWQIVLLVGFIFGGLALGCGAVAGLIASRWARHAQASTKSRRVVGWTAVGAGLLLMVGAVPFLAPGLPMVAVAFVVLGLVAGGLWGALAKGRE